MAWLLGQTKGGPLSVEQEKEAEATSVSRIRVLHEEDEEEEDDRLDGVEKVLQGLVASEGGRSLSLQVSEPMMGWWLPPMVGRGQKGICNHHF